MTAPIYIAKDLFLLLHYCVIRVMKWVSQGGRGALHTFSMWHMVRLSYLRLSNSESLERSTSHTSVSGTWRK